MAAPANINPTAATTIDSTETAPHGETLSAISMPRGPPQEAVAHTGNINMIDPYYYQQNIQIANLTWTSSQSQGTRLWGTKITPKKGHPHLRRLAAHYNGWTGGFIYSTKFNATGLNFGAVIMAWLPPNIDPDTVTGINQLTHFEYIIIDAKTMGIMSHHASDQRRMAYHYTMDDSTPDGHGGYTGLWVFSPLGTSSTGSNQVSIQVLMKCAPDFQFTQIIPYVNEEDEVAKPGEFEDIARVCDFTKEVNRTGIGHLENELLYMVIEPSTVQKPVNTATAGCYNIVGDPLQTHKFQFPMKSAYNTTNTTGVRSSIFPAALQDLPKGDGTYSMCATTTLRKNIFDKTRILSMPEAGELAVTSGGDISDPSAGYVEGGEIFVSIKNYVNKDAVIPRKLATESYVTFSTDPDSAKTSKSLQSLSLARLLKTKAYEGKLEPTDALIFDLYDTESSSPLYRVKLSQKGTVTTKAVTDQILLPVKQFKWQFVQVAKESEPIPAPDAHQVRMTNLHALTFTARKQIELLQLAQQSWQQSQQFLEGPSSPASDQE